MTDYPSDLCQKVVNGQMIRSNLIDASTTILEGPLTGPDGVPSNGLIMHGNRLAM